MLSLTLADQAGDCIQPLLLQQESRLTAKIDALSHKLDAVLELFSRTASSLLKQSGMLSVLTITGRCAWQVA